MLKNKAARTAKFPFYAPVLELNLENKKIQHVSVKVGDDVCLCAGVLELEQCGGVLLAIRHEKPRDLGEDAPIDPRADVSTHPYPRNSPSHSPFLRTARVEPLKDRRQQREQGRHGADRQGRHRICRD